MLAVQIGAVGAGGGRLSGRQRLLEADARDSWEFGAPGREPLVQPQDRLLAGIL
jgi:hypothetical protein